MYYNATENKFNLLCMFVIIYPHCAAHILYRLPENSPAPFSSNGTNKLVCRNVLVLRLEANYKEKLPFKLPLK